MNSNEAVELIASRIEIHSDEELTASKVVDYDTYWYVIKTHVDDPTVVGGYAYVIAEETGAIFAVPGGMPPHFNLRSVIDGDALEIEK